MIDVKFPTGKVWQIRSPVVVRQMQAEYVDAFFLDGSLRLSSFKSFRDHPDERRRDQGEGKTVMEISERDGMLSVLGMSGSPAYIICASSEESQERTPVGQARLRILDTVRFADAVSRCVPGFDWGTEGPCVYRQDTVLRKKGNRPLAPPTNGKDIERWFREQDRYVGQHAVDGFFLKHIDFVHEAEYRFIWFATGEPLAFVDIKCPAAREYCQRV